MFDVWSKKVTDTFNIKSVRHLFFKEDLFFRLLGGVFCVLLVFILFLSFYKKFNHDEFEAIHVSWKILNGERIYIDFFENHHPFFFHLLAPLIGIFKESVNVIVAARGLIFVMLLLIFAVTYNISKNLLGKEAAIIGLILLATTKIFILKAVEVRTDVPQVLFGLLSISLLFSYLQNKSLKYLIGSSLFLGVSFLFLQKTVFLAFIIGLLLVLSAYSKQVRFKDVGVYLLVFIAVLAPYYGYLILNGQLHAYWINNWTMNIGAFQTNASRGEYAIQKLIFAFKDNPLLWVFWILFFIFMDTQYRERIGSLCLFLLIVFVSIQVPWFQYLMLPLPLVAMMAGYAVYRVASLFPKWKIIIISGVVIISIFYSFNTYLKGIKDSSNTTILKKIEYVVSITNPKDFVYDGDIQFNLFRKDLDFFWFHTGNNYSNGARSWSKDYVKYHYNIYELIDKFKPKVISSHRILDLKDDAIAKHYRRSDEYQDLFIRTN